MGERIEAVQGENGPAHKRRILVDGAGVARVTVPSNNNQVGRARANARVKLQASS